MDHLDKILWGANPNTCKGDLILMYRTAPYSDIAYIFSARSALRPTRRSDAADTPYVIQRRRWRACRSLVCPSHRT